MLRRFSLMSPALGTVLVVSLLLRQPAALADGNATRGKEMFEKATCVVCHPGGGNNVNPHDPLKGEHFAREFNTDDKIVKVVRSGIKGTAMPAFGKDKVSDANLKDIIAYIRSLTPKSAK